MRKVERDFHVSVSRLHLTREHELLYARYRVHVGGDRADTLREVLYDEHDNEDIFGSWMVEVRGSDGQLAAYSVFDSGHESMMSIIGVYDPDRAKLGLGIATMLFEIRWGIAHGYKYHYSGYVVPGVPSFEYKRDVGRLEAWDPDLGMWQPLGTPDPQTLPAGRMQRALEGLADQLSARGIPCRLRCYPPYRLVHVNRLQDRCLGLPLLLDCGRAQSRPGGPRLIVSYDPVVSRFYIDSYLGTRDLREVMSDASLPDSGPRPEWQLLVRVRALGNHGGAGQVIEQVSRLVGPRV